MLMVMAPGERGSQEHPLRRVKQLAGSALEELSTLFDEMYSTTGRPSIPPERLLKASLLMALYTVRSERLFCEQLAYNLLFRWRVMREDDLPGSRRITLAADKGYDPREFVGASRALHVTRHRARNAARPGARGPYRAPRGLCRQSARAQAGRGDFRLDEDGRRPAPDSLSRTRPRPAPQLPGRCRPPSAPNRQTQPRPRMNHPATARRCSAWPAKIHRHR